MVIRSSLSSFDWLTLDGVVFLHLRLIVIIQTVDGLSLHVVFLVGLSINCRPRFLEPLLGHLEAEKEAPPPQ